MSRTSTKSNTVSSFQRTPGAWPHCLGVALADCAWDAAKQTMEFNINIRAQFKKTTRARMGKLRDAHDRVSIFSPPVTGIWEAMELLNTLVDESDPDVSLAPWLFESSQLAKGMVDFGITN